MKKFGSRPSKNLQDPKIFSSVTFRKIFNEILYKFLLNDYKEICGKIFSEGVWRGPENSQDPIFFPHNVEEN